MVDVGELGNLTWRDWSVEGVPSSGPHRPSSADIRTFVTALEQQTRRAFSSVAALRTYRGNAVDGRVVAREIFGDRGGGPFSVRQGDTSTPDDGALTVVDDLGRRWAREVSREYSTEFWGARGDVKNVTSSSVKIALRSKTLVVPAAQFSSADVGKLIVVSGAGPSGEMLSTKITAINSPTSVELLHAAGATLPGSLAYVTYGTDDTEAIQNAVDYVAGLPLGGVVVLDSRCYAISSAIVVPKNAEVELVGTGMASTVLLQMNLNANGIEFSRDDYASGGRVSSLTIESGPGRQIANCFGPGSSGTGITADGMADNFAIDNVAVHNFAKGVSLLGCWNTRHGRLEILFFKDVGLEIDKSVTTGVGGGNAIDFAKISNFGYMGVITDSKGVRVRASGGEFFNTIDVTGCGKSMVIDPRVGDLVAYVSGYLCSADASIEDGIVLDGSAGKIGGFLFENLWAGFNRGNGVRIKGANASNIVIGSCRLRENVLNGLQAETGDFFVLGGSINNNSRDNPGKYDGVHVEPGVSNWAILNCFLGNDRSSSVSHQRNGINIERGPSHNFLIHGDIFSGNLKAGLANGASGTDFRIEGNLPRTDAVVNRTNGWFSGTLDVGENAAIAHVIKQGNDSALTIYSDAVGEVVLDPCQASNPAAKFNLNVCKHGGGLISGGFIQATNELRIDGTKVVEVRKRGWGVPTGTATKSSFNTTTVTTAQLAERLKALIDDLAAHGLIGS